MCQEIGPPATRKTKASDDLRVTLHTAQSETLYPMMVGEEAETNGVARCICSGITCVLETEQVPISHTQDSVNELLSMLSKLRRSDWGNHGLPSFWSIMRVHSEKRISRKVRQTLFG